MSYMYISFIILKDPMLCKQQAPDSLLQVETMFSVREAQKRRADSQGSSAFPHWGDSYPWMNGGWSGLPIPSCQRDKSESAIICTDSPSLLWMTVSMWGILRKAAVQGARVSMSVARAPWRKGWGRGHWRGKVISYRWSMLPTANGIFTGLNGCSLSCWDYNSDYWMEGWRGNCDLK